MIRVVTGGTYERNVTRSYAGINSAILIIGNLNLLLGTYITPLRDYDKYLYLLETLGWYVMYVSTQLRTCLFISDRLES